MRLEYFEAIRYRRWEELEHYAKKCPEQALADTVYQLVETIDNKADRRTLKRILWILSEAGFVGRDYIEDPPEPKPKRPNLLGAAIMLPNQHGYTGFMAVAARNLHTDALLFSVLERWGYCSSTPLESIRIRQFASKFKSYLQAAPRLAVPAPPAWVLWRMARARRAMNSNLPVNQGRKPSPTWQRRLDEAEEVPHPMAAMPIPDLDASARKELLLNLPHIQAWRLTLPPTDDVWTAIHSLRWDPLLVREDRELEIVCVLRDHRERLFDKGAVAELHERLLDTAFMLNASGEPRGSMLLSVAKDFQEHREDSFFAYWLMGKTALDLDANLDSDEFDMEEWGTGSEESV